MKLHVSKEAATVLEELYALLLTEEAKGEGHYLKLNRAGYPNSGVMPVVVETMRDFGNGRKVISVAHYFEMNGDLCADPYMEFLRVPNFQGRPQDEDVLYCAIRFKQEGSIFAMDRDSIILNQTTGAPERYNQKAAVQDRVFATTWMRNIAVQQNLNAKSKIRVQ